MRQKRRQILAELPISPDQRGPSPTQEAGVRGNETRRRAEEDGLAAGPGGRWRPWPSRSHVSVRGLLPNAPCKAHAPALQAGLARPLMPSSPRLASRARGPTQRHSDSEAMSALSPCGNLPTVCSDGRAGTTRVTRANIAEKLKQRLVVRLPAQQWGGDAGPLATCSVRLPPCPAASVRLLVMDQ